MTSIGKTVARNIRRLRNARGWTQREVAERLTNLGYSENVDQRQISRWEDVKRPPNMTLKNLEMISRVFDVPPYVLTLDESEPLKSK